MHWPYANAEVQSSGVVDLTDGLKSGKIGYDILDFSAFSGVVFGGYYVGHHAERSGCS